MIRPAHHKRRRWRAEKIKGYKRRGGEEEEEKQRGRPGGTVPQNLRWGDGLCIGPPIFREVVLSDVCERMNRVKKLSY